MQRKPTIVSPPPPASKKGNVLRAGPQGRPAPTPKSYQNSAIALRGSPTRRASLRNNNSGGGCCSSAKKLGMVVGIFSIIAILAGGANVYFGLGYFPTTGLAHVGSAFNNDNVGLLSYVVLGAGATGVIGGTLGIFQCCCKSHRCMAAIISPLLFIFTVVNLAAGFLLLLMTMSNAETFTNAVCGDFETYVPSTLPIVGANIDLLVTETIQPEIANIDSAFASLPNGLMCSNTCPCDEAKAAEFKALSNTELKKIKRSSSSRDSSSTYVQMKYYDMTDPSNAEQITYDSFKDCYDAIRDATSSVSTRTKEGKLTTALRSEVSKELVSQYIDVMSAIEEAGSCTGLCTSPIFSWTLSVEQGINEVPCGGAGLKSMIDSSVGLISYITLGTGLFLLLAFIMNFCMCRKLNVDAADNQLKQDPSASLRSLNGSFRGGSASPLRSPKRINKV